MPEALPTFRYHPDPVSAGSVEESSTPCRRCGHVRGWIYRGAVYTKHEVDGELCPWCIEDGSAADAFDALFTDAFGVPSDVPRDVVEQITRRTPGFTGWQQERWLYHCGDGAELLGRAGHEELRDHPDAIESIRAENAQFGWSDERHEEYLGWLHRDGDLTAYLFRCLHCGRHLAYTDAS
jgi:uncharacterized protein CbrC (UPF0167 family)